ncbi:TRAP transporter small permease subunit [Amphritea sp. 1_MG-2023]|uniref:TRAP transporter small permease n=1 Tax=Amphritea sp. 1_MG-2023 TaxID=3062670 RepID=UPI0026E28E2C|nr:TRAP transporter small permease subunit [Amphritea sp. 1_MG-2023]MDO6564369.1 TRAP transporter small permease subunit [Amphritea sp. 1_MG-2023]
MRAFWTQLDKWFAVILENMVLLTSAAVAGLVFFQVITRYVLEISVIGLDELALISAMWLYMTGALIASRRAEHLVVDFLPQQIKSSFWQKCHQKVIALIMVSTCAFFVYLSWRMLSFAIRRPQYTEGLDIPQLVAQGAIILASVGCFLYALRDLFTGRACHNVKEAEEE